MDRRKACIFAGIAILSACIVALCLIAARGMAPSPDQRALRQHLEESGALAVIEAAARDIIDERPLGTDVSQRLRKAGVISYSYVPVDSGERMAEFKLGGGILHFGLLVGQPRGEPHVRGLHLFQWSDQMWFYADEDVRDTR